MTLFGDRLLFTVVNRSIDRWEWTPSTPFTTTNIILVEYERHVISTDEGSEKTLANRSSSGCTELGW